ALAAVPASDLPRSGRGGDPRPFRHLAYGLSKFGRAPAGVVDDFHAEVNWKLTSVPDLNDPTKMVDDSWTLDALRRKVDIIAERGPTEYGGGWKPDDTDEPPAAWNDPDRQAREYLAKLSMAGLQLVRVKRNLFRYDGGAYAPLSDESHRGDLRDHLRAEAEKEYRRQCQKHDQDPKRAQRRKELVDLLALH